VAVPRRFDRRPPERDLTRINERIRVPEVRVIDDEGNQVGMMKTPDAVKFAQERDLDLVEVAPEAKPPVCRVLDYSKYKYEQAQKVKQARKHQQQITIREIKFRPKIAQHDYDTKKHHVERFLRHKDKVKITIMFRGREVTHPERGVMILDRLAEELAALGIVEQRPTQDGRNMTMMLGPSKAVLSGKVEGEDGTAEVDGREASHDGANGSPETRASTDGAVPASAVESSPDGVAPAPVVVSSPDGADGSPEAEASTDGVAPASAAVSSPDGVVPAPAVVSSPDSAITGSTVVSSPDDVAPASSSSENGVEPDAAVSGNGAS
jgi:translation initiation factor IF-3